MLLGPKTATQLFVRHLIAGAISALLVYFVWYLNSSWSPDMRLWKAFGGGAFALLWFTMLIGPVAKIWPVFMRLLTWRRETGIWFVLIALVHAYLVLDGWARWSVWSFLGYQYVADLDIYLRAEPGFGLANLMGLTALVFALSLFATSSDKAVDYLGVSSWKWLHTLGYVVFYLIALHVVYFAFIHFTPSPERIMRGLPTNYPANPLRFYYLGALFSVFFAQLFAFKKIVSNNRVAHKNDIELQKRIKVNIQSVSKVAKDTFEISFTRPKDFKFEAGQHMHVYLDKLKYPDPKGASRVMSICSSPYDNSKLSIAFRSTGSGYKNTLIEMKPGDSVFIEGPLGHFVLPDQSDGKHIFIAGGIGITPFISMILASKNRKNIPDIELFYANREKDSAAFLKELEYLDKNLKNFSLTTKYGRIEKADLRKYQDKSDNIVWWIVGPQGMVAATRGILNSIGVSDADIKVEEFTGY